jgi:glycosyltransferase involved in cell wall biosynthesis
VVLFLSRLDPKKNVEGLIRAFATLRPSHPSARLVIAGAGAPDYVRSLRTLGASEGIDDKIHWAGHLEGNAKWGALRAADVFVLPSYSENFGIAAVEAMMAGRPCIVGGGVALAEEMDTAGAGIATEPEPSAIAGALDRLLSDDRLCTEMGARAAALASQRFSADAMGAGLAELYARIIQETGRTVSPSAAADTETSRDSRIANRSAAQP